MHSRGVKLWVGGAIAAGSVVLLAGLALAGAGDDARIEATGFHADSNQGGQGVARCHGDKRAVGGGVVEIGPADGLDVRASGPRDASGSTRKTKDGDKAKQWYASVFNGAGGSVKFKTFAICSASSDARIEATAFSVVGFGQVGEDVAKCPSGRRALGGGVVQRGPADNLYVRASGPLDASGLASETNDGDKAKRWYAQVRNSSVETVRLKVFAICSAHSSARLEVTGFSVDPFSAGDGYAVCQGSKRALGGGVLQVEPNLGLFVEASGPLDDTGFTANTKDGDKAKQWYGAVRSNQSDPVNIKVLAICE